MGDKAWDEVCQIFDVDNSIFQNHEFIHAVHSCVEAIFKQKAYEDYVIASEPDPDSGSRIVLIDKATGRLARGRTLNESLHSFVELKEGVFTGIGSASSMQITYQVLFNLFPHITGVTGTLGKCFKEFTDIYNASVIQIPDRFPSQLKQKTHLFNTRAHLLGRMVEMIHLYQASRHPILIGAASDVEAEIVSDYLSQRGVDHVLLVSTDDNEDVVIASAGEVGSIVVTTDIMGRGTDIHIKETDYERGLVVFQVGSRPNSRVERQFAGRAARQGDPGRYHRMLTLPEMEDMGFVQSGIHEVVSTIRPYHDRIEDYGGDVLMNGAAPYYERIVELIDEALFASESAMSQQRIQDFQVSSLADLIQVSLVSEADRYRELVKESLVTHELDGVIDVLARLSLPAKLREKKKLIAMSRKKWEGCDEDTLLNTLFDYSENLVHNLFPIFANIQKWRLELPI